jgi:hypothetical protein
MLTVLVITGSTLSGASKGIQFYIGSINATKFKEPSVWKDAASQVFFSTSACSGGLIAMSSFNAFRNNILRDVFLIPLLDWYGKRQKMERPKIILKNYYFLKFHWYLRGIRHILRIGLHVSSQVRVDISRGCSSRR